jgi:DNA-3-methyladenine glycosylase
MISGTGEAEELVGREFFARGSLEVAPELLGLVLAHRSDEGTVAGVITEVEAYTGSTDPASHAWRGRTARNGVMFGPPGHAYVYFTYGMYFCVNLVTFTPDDASAVLLRAARVTVGAELAGRRRAAARRRPRGAAGDASEAGPVIPVRELARGPGLLCLALGIDRTLDGADVCTDDSPLRVLAPAGWVPFPAAAIAAGPRVGVSQAADRPWRFWLAGDPSVSAYRRLTPRRPGQGKPVTGPGR